VLSICLSRSGPVINIYQRRFRQSAQLVEPRTNNAQDSRKQTCLTNLIHVYRLLAATDLLAYYSSTFVGLSSCISNLVSRKAVLLKLFCTLIFPHAVDFVTFVRVTCRIYCGLSAKPIHCATMLFFTAECIAQRRCY